MNIHLFCGYDARESIGFHVFLASVLDRTSVPVTFRRLDARGMPVGSNDFTFSRFLVPWLQRFRGRAIFADASDMLMLGDIAQLDRLFDPSKAIQCVQHNYATRHPLKYLGTDMQCPNRDYPRKNWASLMIINCEHEAWRHMTPAAVQTLAASPLSLLGLKWLSDEHIGALPDHWNRLVDEGQALDGAAVLHWTAGIPAFAHYKHAPGATLWMAERNRMVEVTV